MKYCLTTTKSHSFIRGSLDCLIEINSIIKHEGGDGKLFKEDNVLNLDEAEKKAAIRDKRSTRSSMDIFFGISKKQISNGDQQEPKNPKFILAEFKFNALSPSNIKKDELTKKVKDSQELIGFEFDIMNKYYIIFKPACMQQAKSHFARLFIHKTREYIPISEEDFHELYFSN